MVAKAEMRILGFSRRWPKLSQSEFTTFRFARKDKDWAQHELVQVVIKPRSKDRHVLGFAKIIHKDRKLFAFPHDAPLEISDMEAMKDGFAGYMDMRDWFKAQYGNRIFQEYLNKLTLQWQEMRDE